MKKTIDLGKIDYRENGRKTCPATIDIEIRDYPNRPVLSICGNVWNHLKTDIYAGGQIIDEIAGYFSNNPQVQKIHTIWEKWHLNDLHAGCSHQQELGWESEGYDKHPSEPCPICGYKYGTSWNYVPLPDEIIDYVKSL